MNGMALSVCVVKTLHNSQEWLWMLISVHRIHISEKIVLTYEFSYTGTMANYTPANTPPKNAEGYIRNQDINININNKMYASGMHFYFRTA
ncbi:hypothetical protein BOTCAL_0094g00080 [Botryotinia calthae]|uniref:Uncharacterized protein n=1 Tax=Botryotinia calthae TaxID=38488 RepID=A0A4Y8D6P7_9HELO|nr:hypothetical protein BOTCAL_0094g00080 [Botryotinia calthae]